MSSSPWSLQSTLQSFNPAAVSYWDDRDPTRSPILNTCERYPPHKTLPMVHKIFASYALALDYEQKHNVTFNWFVRTRFDGKDGHM